MINRLEEICVQRLEGVKGLLGAGIFADELEKVPVLLARARNEAAYGSIHSALLSLAEARVLINYVSNQIYLVYFVISAFCFSLFILGSKLRGKTIAQNAIYTALFSLIFIIIASAFTKDIILVIFYSLWIVPFGIATNLEQKHPTSYKLLINIGGFWFLLLCLFLIYQYIMLMFQFLTLSAPVILILLSSYFIHRFKKNVFARAKPVKKSLHESLSQVFPPNVPKIVLSLKKRIYNSFLIPVGTVLFLIMMSEYVHLTVNGGILQILYATFCGILSTLLGITITLTTFLLPEARLSNEIKNLFIRSMKELCLLYGFTIIISLTGLISSSLANINLNIFTTELETILIQTMLFVSVGLFGICLSSLIAVFFEIVDRSSTTEEKQVLQNNV
ncbi:MAG: hypothetical protein QXP99_04535 [Thermoproteota archaeon]